MRSGEGTVRALDPAGSVPAGATQRVSLREIREHTYRAMVTIGASTGEAALTADAVLHAELNAGSGLDDLLAELGRGPWPAGGLQCVRRPESPLDMQVAAGDRAGAPRLGMLLTDLVAGEPAGTTVISDRLIGVGPLLEPQLLRAAVQSARPTLAADPAEDSLTVCAATPDGRCGAGRFSRELLVDLGASGCPDVRQPAIATLDPLEPALRSALTWTQLADRAACRRAAAVGGIRVDVRTWRRVVERASAYLVPYR